LQTYIGETEATFEQEPVTEQQIASRIESVLRSQLPWLVVENETGVVVGYAYASKWREKVAYQHSVEVTIYLANNLAGQGVGTLL